MVTMVLEITALYGGLLVVAFALTSLSVGLYRASNNVMYGTGGAATQRTCPLCLPLLFLIMLVCMASVMRRWPVSVGYEHASRAQRCLPVH